MEVNILSGVGQKFPEGRRKKEGRKEERKKEEEARGVFSFYIYKLPINRPMAALLVVIVMVI